MGSGIRAEVTVDPGDGYPVLEASLQADSRAGPVFRCVDPRTPGRTVEEFVLEADEAPETSVPLEEVFDYGTTKVYRVVWETDSDTSTGDDASSPIGCVERFDCPVVESHTTTDGRIYLVFHTTGMEQLQDVIGGLREEFGDVDVRRLLRSEHDRPGWDAVFVDRGALTDRQREVLETAHEMGYFTRPRGANAKEIARELDISPSTFAEHLAAAQSKLFDDILDA